LQVNDQIEMRVASRPGSKQKMDEKQIEQVDSSERLDGAKALLADLQHQEEEGEGRDGEFELLALMVDEALRGVDIPQRYPLLWQQIMADAALHEAFVDCLELLEASEAGTLRPWPGDVVGMTGEEA
jgi:hypothetical protein